MCARRCRIYVLKGYTHMKMKKHHGLLLSLGLALSVFSGAILFSQKEEVYVPTFATYTNGDADTYYNSIGNKTGDELLSALKTLNKTRRKSTVGYSAMGTSSTSSQYKYTDYDPNTVQYDSNNQPYGTKVLSFYSGNSTSSFNREHVWPNTHGGSLVEADIHMTRPTISSENGSRSHSFYVEGVCIKNGGGWDPAMEDFGEETYRGDSARIIFYCLVADQSGALYLVDDASRSSNTNNKEMGVISDMISWHLRYAPKQREMNRNEGAEYLQGNRNPFIDHPEYVCRIWSGFNSKTQQLCANDPYAGGTTGGSVSISKSTSTMEIGESTSIYAISSDSSKITWSSSNEDAVTISDNESNSGSTVTLYAVGSGTSNITATATIDGLNYSQTCVVTVNEAGGGGSTIEGDSEVIDMTAQGFSSGATVTSVSGGECNVTFDQGSGSNPPKYYTTGEAVRCYANNTFSVSSTGRKIVKIELTFGSGDSSNPITVNAGSYSNGVWTGSANTVIFTVGGSNNNRRIQAIKITYEASEAEVESIDIKTHASNLVYEVGDKFNPSGLVITATYDDETTKDISYVSNPSKFSFSPSLDDALKLTDTSVTITYEGKEVSENITVKEPVTLSSIELSGSYKTSFVEGDEFSFGGKVTAVFSDGSREDITSSASIIGYDKSKTGSQEITVSYTYKEVSKTVKYNVDVALGTLSSISLSGQTTSYTKGAHFAFDGVVTATFANGYSKEVTPTSVSSPDMSKGGTQEVTVSVTYNGVSKTAKYNITVNQYREVIEVTTAESKVGDVTYSGSKETISDSTKLSVSKTTYYNLEAEGLRLGSSDKTGSVTVSSKITSIKFNKVIASIKSYGSDSSVTVKIGGVSKTITSSFTDYTVEFETAVSSVKIETVTNKKRAYIASISVYSVVTTETDIGQTEDCVGLETFINDYMHMDYVENKGYCEDYYPLAKQAFNALNDHQRSLFTSNSAYLVEYNRLAKWAEILGDEFNSNNKLEVGLVNPNSFDSNENISLTTVIVISAFSVLSASLLLIIKKRKRSK